MTLLKVSCSQPHTLFAGEDLQCVSIDGTSTFQCTMSHALEYKHTNISARSKLDLALNAT